MVRPTKMRNRQIYKASHAVRSRQVSANLSKSLREKYNRRSVRVVEGDSVTIKRGEYIDVSGKIEDVFTKSGRVAISGIKKEKANGDKFDVPIHASNLVVTGLHLGDPRRNAKIGAVVNHAPVDNPATTGFVTARTTHDADTDDLMDDESEYMDADTSSTQADKTEPKRSES